MLTETETRWIVLGTDGRRAYKAHITVGVG